MDLSKIGKPQPDGAPTCGFAINGPALAEALRRLADDIIALRVLPEQVRLVHRATQTDFVAQTFIFRFHEFDRPFIPSPKPKI